MRNVIFSSLSIFFLLKKKKIIVGSVEPYRSNNEGFTKQIDERWRNNMFPFKYLKVPPHVKKITFLATTIKMDEKSGI
jgi:hypothetical protein